MNDSNESFKLLPMPDSFQWGNNANVVFQKLNKVLVHVFVTSSKKFMKSVLKQSFFQQFLMTYYSLSPGVW